MAARGLTSCLSSQFSGNFFQVLARTQTKLFANCRNYASAPRIQHLDRGNGNKIAYYQLAGKNPSLPGIVMCSGFQSNMNGVKAMAVEEYCRQKQLGYVRFDYQGCGKSTGDIRDMTLTDWKGDVIAILDQVTAGPQLIIGASLGGWLMLFAAIERPHRIHSLVGIATAADFPTRGFSRYPKEVRDQVQLKGETTITEGEYSFLLTREFFKDAQNHSILDADEKIPITCPVHLLHGLQDNTVPYSAAVELAQKLSTKDVQLVFSKSGGHRFSHASEVQLLYETIDLLVWGAEDVRELAITSWSAFSRYPNPEVQTDVTGPSEYKTFRYNKR